MIEEPDRYIDDFVDRRRRHDLGARRSGAAPAPDRHADQAASAPRRASCSIRRRRSSTLEDIAADLDFVLVMSVNPGFGGQSFIPHSLEKVRRVRELLAAAGSAAPIEIDGGIDLEQCRRRRRGRRHDPRRRQCHLRHARSPKRPRARCAASPVSAASRNARVIDPPAYRRPAARGCASATPRPTDGRRLLRQLPGLVRGRRAPNGCARRGWSYREMEQRRHLAAGDRGALRVPPAGPLRRRARDPDAGDAAHAGPHPLRLRGAAAATDAAPAALGHTVHAALDRSGRPCRLPERVPSLLNAEAPPLPTVCPCMKALVTGAAGFIGSHLAEAAASPAARTVDRPGRLHGLLPARAIKERNLAELRTMAGFDARSKGRSWPTSTCRTCCDGVTHVFHLAAQPDGAEKLGTRVPRLYQ